MKNLTVIVPIHEFNEEIAKLLENAMYSFMGIDDGETKLLFVGPSEVLKEVKNKIYPNIFDRRSHIIFLENENTLFQAQINAAVEKCDEYFSILEFDDTYTKNWFKNVEKYMENNDASIYLPLTHVYLFKDREKGPIGYVNETVWATSFSNELGYLDIESLMNYMDFNTTGGVFKTEDFKKIGGLKESMKLTFWYEFLLRTLFNGKKIYVVPKVGYNHFLDRKGSLTDIYNDTISEEEAEFWIDTAKHEYMFIKDREKKYEK